eukprot:1159277-Pelagomonas_calceolata.AAC.3
MLYVSQKPGQHHEPRRSKEHATRCMCETKAWAIQACCLKGVPPRLSPPHNCNSSMAGCRISALHSIAKQAWPGAASQPSTQLQSKHGRVLHLGPCKAALAKQAWLGPASQPSTQLQSKHGPVSHPSPPHYCKASMAWCRIPHQSGCLHSS